MYNFYGDYLDCNDISRIYCRDSGNPDYPYRMYVYFLSPVAGLYRDFTTKRDRDSEAAKLSAAVERAKYDAFQDLKSEITYMSRTIQSKIQLLKNATNRLTRAIKSAVDLQEE